MIENIICLLSKKLKNTNKNIKISSDFIVGYPGETKKDFEDTIKLVKEIGFINSYSFVFSPRTGTPAATKKLNNLEENKKDLKNCKISWKIFNLKITKNICINIAKC